MNNGTAIDSRFLTSADKLGIPKPSAINIYLRKRAKKGVDDIVFDLVSRKYFPSYSAARAAIRDAWFEFTRSQYSRIKPLNNPVKPDIVDKQSFLDQAREELERMIGNMGKVTKKPKPISSSKEILICSDLHVPFLCEKTFSAILDSDASEIVVLGDIFDMYAASKYRTTIDYITVREELAQGRAILETLSKRFDKVLLLKSGNHDIRGLRRIQDLAPQLLPLIVHPLDIITTGLPNLSILSTEIPNTAPNVTHGKNMVAEFMGFDADRLYGHFENFSGAEAAIQVDTWLGNWYHTLGVSEKVNYVFQSHCHRLSQTITPRGRVLVNTGCVCKVMPYQIEAHGKYPPPTNGFITLQADNNNNVVGNSIKLNYVRI